MISQIAIGKIDDCYRRAWLGGAKGKDVVKVVDGDKPPEPPEQPKDELKWSFANAVIFTFTIITTIGNIFMVPKRMFDF